MWALLVGAAGTGGAVGRVLRHRNATGTHLAQVAEATERLAHVEVIAMDAEERHRVVRRTELAAANVRVEERLRSARRQWATIAGASADPHDIEAVLRARDPQYDLAGATSTSPTIRAVDTMHRRAAARWRVAWAAIGVDRAPPPAELDAAVAARNQRTEPALVLVDPATWVAADRLAELLAQLPADRDVYLIRRSP